MVRLHFFASEWSYSSRKNLELAAQTAFFLAIVVVQWSDLIVSKTRKRSIFRHGMKNWPLVSFWTRITASYHTLSHSLYILLFLSFFLSLSYSFFLSLSFRLFVIALYKGPGVPCLLKLYYWSVLRDLAQLKETANR